MKVHVFCVGGTGARIYRAFIHCLASGVFSDILTNDIEFCSYIVDSDISNGDGEKAQQVASSYVNIHQDVYSDVIRPVDCPYFSNPLHNHTIQIPDNLKESELYDVSMFSERTNLFFSALVGDVRFRSDDGVNKELRTYLAMSSVSLDDFEKNYDFNKDKVILTGSTFGITGYSCLPQLASRIVRIIRDDKPMHINPRFAMVCVGPYFEVKRSDSRRYDSFLSRQVLYDYFCHKVLREEMHEISQYNILPINRPDYVEYVEGGVNQCLPAHIVELYAVTAITDFINRQPTERCEFSLKIESKYNNVTSNDLPDIMRHYLDRLLCFSIWCRKFGNKPFSKDEKIIRYSEDFFQWLQELGQHEMAFRPIDFDREKLSQSFRWYIPKKKYGLFNSDPLGNKKLDRLYRKTLHLKGCSLPQKSKELFVQYKVCSLSWELFKKSCYYENSQLNENGWRISQHEVPPFFSPPEYFNSAFPTLFSRLWLCDFAFSSLVTENQLDFSRYNFVSSIGSQCIDLLEFLFDYADHPDLKIKRLSIKGVIDELKNHGSLNAKWLSETLHDDKSLLPSKFAESDIYIFLFRGHVIGGTSPFTLVFTSPQCKELFYSWSNEFGRRFFDRPVPFERREPRFQKYLLCVMASLHHVNSIYRYVYSLTNETRILSFDGFNDSYSTIQSFDYNYIPLIDENHLNVTIVTEDGVELVLGSEPGLGCDAPDTEIESRYHYYISDIEKKNKPETYLPGIDGCEKSEEIIYSSIFAPSEVRQKSHMLVQVYLHLYEETEKIKVLAQESDRNAERRDYIPLQCKLKKGDNVDVLLNIYGETLLMSDKKIVVWQGSFTKCSFDYFVPKDIDVDELSCVALLSVNGVPVGEMRFITQIVEVPRQLNPEIIAHKYSKVFISYSHQDESKVKFLHEGLELGSVPHFFDRKYLKAGDVFPQVIQDYINSADLFILCWSENASKSEYVQKERLQALERAFPQVQPEKAAKLRIYPMSIEPHAELPGDMKNYYHFGEI